jgi:hypothetical protein
MIRSALVQMRVKASRLIIGFVEASGVCESARADRKYGEVASKPHCLVRLFQVL